MPDSPPQRPEDVHFISGVILVSHQPEPMAGFYRDVLGLPLAEERHGDTQPHWGCELGDVHFAIHPAEDYPDDPATGPGPVKLAFIVFNLPRMIAWLEECGIPLCYPPTDLGTQSQITAVRDPDGNLVELTQLGPGWLDHLKAHRADGHDLVTRWSAHLGTGTGAGTPLTWPPPQRTDGRSATRDGDLPRAGLMVADHYHHEHDNHCSYGQAHDDHRGIGQTDQVQPGCARISQRFLPALGLAPLPPISRRRW